MKDEKIHIHFLARIIFLLMFTGLIFAAWHIDQNRDFYIQERDFRRAQLQR